MKLSQTRRLLLGAALTLAFASAHAAWPERPIKVIVPSAPGGGPDNIMRLVAAELSKRLGQSVFIENRAGAAGNIGMQTLMTAAPDGYTLGYGNNATLATNEFLFTKLPYDPQRVEPIVQLTRTASLVVVNNNLPVRNVRELMDYALKNPNKLTFSSGGIGTSGHIGAELFRTMSQAKMLHVPYKGAPQAINDLMAGQVDALIDNYSSVGPHVNTGKLRALAVTSLDRSPLFPNVPTAHESGLPGFEITAWSGLIAPPGTPAEVIERMNKEVNAVIQDKETQAKLLQMGSSFVGGSPEDFARFIKTERSRWGELVRKTGAKVD